MNAPHSYFIRTRTFILLIATIFICTGCATSQFSPENLLRPAENAPDYFLVGKPNSSETTKPEPGQACRNPMIDPRDSTRIKLVRSSPGGQGDYSVPVGKYGVNKNELLRINCSTGQAIGVVKE